MMIKQENVSVSRRALLKGLFAAPLMIPFQTADAQTLYRAITAGWEEKGSASLEGLVICSKSFSFSQPSHIVEAFGDLYGSFRTVDTVVRDIGRGGFLPVGNQKVGLGNKWVPVDNQVVSKHYGEVTTHSPKPGQQDILDIVNTNNPFSIQPTTHSYYGGPLAAFQHDLAGAMFYRQRASIITATITLALFHLAYIRELLVELEYLHKIGSAKLPWKKKEAVSLITSASTEEGVEWIKEPGVFRSYNPSIYHNMTEEHENTPSYGLKCLKLGTPGGKKHRRVTVDNSFNQPIRLGWYPSYEQQSWMGESPDPWYFDDNGQPRVGKRQGKRLFNLVTYRNRRGQRYGRFFTVT